MMLIDNKFDIGELVYVVTDKEQDIHIITSIKIIPGPVLLYAATLGRSTADFYDFELSPEPNIALKTS